MIGDVQGVFYRFSAKQEAEKLELTGWAQNEPDESVLIIVEGEDLTIQEFIKWLRVGPPMAEVNNVQVQEEDYKDEFKGFEVR